MKCTLSELRCKEVVETKTGVMLGRIDDIEIDIDSSTVDSVIVYGRPKFFGLLGRDSDIVIKYSDIDLVGKDAVLVTSDISYARLGTVSDGRLKDSMHMKTKENG